jgi:hypothetical protein
VRPACPAMGVHRSTYYRLKRRVDGWGLEALQIGERRGPGGRTRSVPDGATSDRFLPRASGLWADLGELAREERAGSGSRSMGLAGALPLRAQHPPQAAGADRPPPRSLMSGGSRSRRESATSTPPRRAKSPARLLLRRPPQGIKGTVWQHTAADVASGFAGQNATRLRRTRASDGRASWCTASRANSRPPAGAYRRSPQTTAPSSAPALSPTPSRRSEPPTGGSRPAGPTQSPRRATPAHHPRGVLAPAFAGSLVPRSAALQPAQRSV